MTLELSGLVGHGYPRTTLSPQNGYEIQPGRTTRTGRNVCMEIQDFAAMSIRSMRNLSVHAVYLSSVLVLPRHSAIYPAAIHVLHIVASHLCTSITYMCTKRVFFYCLYRVENKRIVLLGTGSRLTVWNNKVALIGF